MTRLHLAILRATLELQLVFPRVTLELQLAFPRVTLELHHLVAGKNQRLQGCPPQVSCQSLLTPGRKGLQGGEERQERGGVRPPLHLLLGISTTQGQRPRRKWEQLH